MLLNLTQGLFIKRPICNKNNKIKYEKLSSLKQKKFIHPIENLKK